MERLDSGPNLFIQGRIDPITEEYCVPLVDLESNIQHCEPVKIDSDKVILE